MRPYGTHILLASFPAKKSIILYKLIIVIKFKSLVIYKWSMGMFALQTFAIATFGKTFDKNVLFSQIIPFVVELFSLSSINSA
jgi:hypothetical protein